MQCDWDHNGVCHRKAKYEVNGPDGYFICGIHKSSAMAIGETDILPWPPPECGAKIDIKKLGSLGHQVDLARHEGKQCTRGETEHELHWTGPDGIWFSDRWRLDA